MNPSILTGLKGSLTFKNNGMRYDAEVVVTQVDRSCDWGGPLSVRTEIRCVAIGEVEATSCRPIPRRRGTPAAMSAD